MIMVEILGIVIIIIWLVVNIEVNMEDVLKEIKVYTCMYVSLGFYARVNL